LGSIYFTPNFIKYYKRNYMAGKLSKDDIEFLRATIKKAGIRKTCKELDKPQDFYYNIIRGASHNRDNYRTLLNQAIDIITREDDNNVE